MASTNKTSNYDLSQFVGADKPAWLSDYNSDMSKIDAGIKSAADAATGADGKADANSGKIGTLANLNTTAKTDLVSAINEANTLAGAAQGVANTANGKATTNATAIAALEADVARFNFTTFKTPNVTGSGMNITTNEIKTATNSDGSVGKIYGTIFATVNSTSGNFTIADTGFRPATNINIDGICWRQDMSGDKLINILPLTIHTNGTITLQNNMTPYWNGKTIALLFPACVLFLQDFGD